MKGRHAKGGSGVPGLPSRATSRERDAQTPREPMEILPHWCLPIALRLKEFVGAMSRTMFKERKIGEGLISNQPGAGRE